MKILFTIDKLVGRAQRSNATAPQVFVENALKNPSKVLFMNEHNRNYTFQDVHHFSNQIGNYFTGHGLKKGDDVALFMESSAEYITIWLGLSKAGVIPALVNNNQKRDGFIHSVNIVNAKAVIFDNQNREAVKEVMPVLKQRGVKFFMIGDGQVPEGAIGMQDLDQASKDFNLVPGNFTDKLLHIYTSGTTGYPKAVIIKNTRYITAGYGVNAILNIDQNDIVYNCLPLHHFAGGIMGTSQAIIKGTPLGLRSKFSASSYFDDCIRYNATVGQYVGELCRYLFISPEKPSDKQHKVRVMFGNGMRPNLWLPFQERFKVPWIAEVYGTSEGNAQIVNLDGKPGACGFLSRFLPRKLMKKIYPVSIIKCNPDSGEPIRDEKGLCIPCEPGEVGQFIGKIVEKDPVRNFDGYSSKEETEKKIIKDIFAKGEKAFASGDLLYMDELGYCYFQDRTGDTFRWKGENVSTTEVEAVIMKESGLGDCVVYGVSVPGNEGKAGMAALTDPNKSIDVNVLLSRLQESLPNYSIPLFLRISDKIEATATFKLPKTSLQKESYDLKKVKDPIFVLNKLKKMYVRLDVDILKDLEEGRFPL